MPIFSDAQSIGEICPPDNVNRNLTPCDLKSNIYIVKLINSIRKLVILLKLQPPALHHAGKFRYLPKTSQYSIKVT
jgi:hypothetical protein